MKMFVYILLQKRVFLFGNARVIHMTIIRGISLGIYDLRGHKLRVVGWKFKALNLSEFQEKKFKI